MAKDVPYTPLFALVKFADIGLVTIYFFFLGIAFAKVFDYVYGKFVEEDYKKTSRLRLFLEIIVHIFLIGIVAYFLRNIVEFIPFPLEGVGGFQHHRLKEIEGGHIMAIVMVLFQKSLHDKINYFMSEVFGLSSGSGSSHE